MLTSPDNLWSPDPTDPVNMVVHWRQSMQSVQDALTSRKQGYLAMTDAQRLDLSGSALFNGLVVYATDTNVLWKYTTSWSLFGFGPFKTQAVASNSSGTATALGTMGPPTGLSLSTSITTAVTCRVKYTLTFQGYMAAPNSGYAAGVMLSGATTFIPEPDSGLSIRVHSNTSQTGYNTYSGSWVRSVSPGTTTFTLGAVALGAGSTRNIRAPYLIVEPVSE